MIDGTWSMHPREIAKNVLANTIHMGTIDADLRPRVEFHIVNQVRAMTARARSAQIFVRGVRKNPRRISN